MRASSRRSSILVLDICHSIWDQALGFLMHFYCIPVSLHSKVGLCHHKHSVEVLEILPFNLGGNLCHDALILASVYV